jgi:UDP-N-acetylmuramate dehydrogenase
MHVLDGERPASERRGAGDVAARALGALAERDVSLAPFTTYKVGGAAEVFVRARSIDDLDLVADAAAASALPVLVVGRGSNLLVSDVGFAGIAVSITEINEIADQIDIDSDSSQVVAGSGVLLPVLARRTVAAGLTGFEWAVGVPGTVGGAVKMNAGGHGSDMSAALVDVVVWDLAGAAGERSRTLPADRLGLRFRASELPDSAVVLTARLQLAPGDREAGERELSDIVAWRRANQPGGQNAGSVFVNPVPGEVSAGALIDSIGLRGHRVGTACVSAKHANFIQADPDGCAADVVAVMREVRARVLAETGFALRSEIRLVGFEALWD